MNPPFLGEEKHLWRKYWKTQDFDPSPQSYQFVHDGVAASKFAGEVWSTSCHLKTPLFWVVLPCSPIAYLLMLDGCQIKSHRNYCQVIFLRGFFQKVKLSLSVNDYFQILLLNIKFTWEFWGHQTHHWWTQSGSQVPSSIQGRVVFLASRMVLALSEKIMSEVWDFVFAQQKARRAKKKFQEKLK